MHISANLEKKIAEMPNIECEKHVCKFIELDPGVCCSGVEGPIGVVCVHSNNSTTFLFKDDISEELLPTCVHKYDYKFHNKNEYKTNILVINKINEPEAREIYNELAQKYHGSNNTSD